MVDQLSPAGGDGPRRFTALPRWLLVALAVLTLVGPVWANILLWPVEYLGYDVDPRSGEVVFVETDSVAAQAGIQLADRLRSVYGEPLEELLSRWSTWPLIEASTGGVAVVVERAGSLHTFLLQRQPPGQAEQSKKIVFALLTAACWITGVSLGLARRHEVNGSAFVATFWLTTAGILGTYVFAATFSLPLLALLFWLMIILLPPLGIGVHVWFPARGVSGRRSQIARRLLAGSLIGSNVLLAVAWFIWRPSLAELLVLAWIPLVFALLVKFVGSGLLLMEAYRQTKVPHIRRQVRLIAAACLLTAAIWLLFRIVPLLLKIPPLLPDALIDLTPIIIPLAYLVSGTAGNLHTLDRLAMRILANVLALTLVAVLFGATTSLAIQVGREYGPWLALGVGLLVVPLVGWTRNWRTKWRSPDRSYRPLREARRELTTSLDSTTLVGAVRTGIARTFTEPPFALYLSDAAAPKTLSLICQKGLPDLPCSLPAGTLTSYLLQGEPIVEARMLHSVLRAAQLSTAEEAALHHQGVALWCVVRHGRDELLALALVGTDGTLEPYRNEDRREIQELFDTASLAFAHSAAYEQLSYAEARLRELFLAMRRVQDETEADLVRTIHDDIINEYVQDNIESVQQLLAIVDDTEQRAELKLLLEGEQGLNEALRSICERLHPLGLKDPWGLPGVLQAQVNRAHARWSGSCSLQVVGEPAPIAIGTGLEIYRITREALANAMKHAAATKITVRLQYPATCGEPLTLTITDNGQAGALVQPRAGHRGLWNMIESARAAGGEVTFHGLPGGGTCVTAKFPAQTELGRREQPISQLLRQLAGIT